MKKILFLISLLVFISCNEKKVNTNINEPILSNNDSLQLDKLLDKITLLNDDDSLKILADRILKNFPNNNAKISEKIAHVFYSKSKLFLTKIYFENSAKQYLVLNDTLGHAKQLTNVGVINELTGDNPAAIENYHKALAIFNLNNEDLKSSYVYNNLGIVYQKFGDFQNSKLNYQKSITICEKLEETQLLVSKFNNLGSLFEMEEGNLDSALFYYEKSLIILDTISDKLLKPIIRANIANVYIQQEKYHKAELLLNTILYEDGLPESTKNTVNKFKAELFLKQERFNESELTVKRVMFFSKNKNYKDDQMYSLRILIDSYVAQKKFKEAYESLNDYLIIKDEIIGLDQKNEVDRLNMKFTVQQKDNQIQLLKIKEESTKKRNRIFYIVISVVILFLLALLYIFNLQKKHTKLEIKTMQNDIALYIKQIHNFEDELNEQELTHHDLFLQKVKIFELTEREEVVLLYISNGLKNTEIADKMFVSINTVKTHIKNIFVKLDVRNRIEATNKAKVSQ